MRVHLTHQLGSLQSTGSTTLSTFFRIDFMASTLQIVIKAIQLNNYTTRMLINLGTSHLLTLSFFPVVILTAIGYDYSE